MTSNSHQIEENFETLKDLFTTMSQAIEQLEQQQSKLEKDNKRLNETNDKLLEITKKQKLMEDTSDESKGTSSKDITNKYRVSLYKKLADLENQLLQNQTIFTDDFNFDEKDPKQMLKLKVQMHSLLEENQTLKDQLSDFQNLHDRIMSEIRSKKNVNSTNQQQENNVKNASPTASATASPTASDSLDKKDMQPLQVNVIDSDVDEVKDK
ncbi:uncharacterized protein LOC112596487 isoform X2 [Melanaphis sacchari]|uniref:uncharacterized protein LOC112596487 isoform X2 n=1 Tax=Melanaphis sacchari TaxID=742174 RepID=UPI000DC149FF|nr:uncharacterized protein LOC112596487 isoform X2 [Melanaphis sacchari]